MSRQFELKERLRKRLIFFLIITGFFFSLLWVRLIEVQILDGKKYNEKSERVIRRVLPIVAPRGEVYDRFYKDRYKSKPIISNKITLNLIAIPFHFGRNQLVKHTLALEKVLHLPKGSLERRVINVSPKSHEKIILIENMTEKQHTIFADFYLEFSNFIIEQSIQRRYNLKNVTSHITGYIGPPSKSDIKKGIKKYQKVGKNGIEKYYDSLLRGKDGEVVQIKNAPGKIQEEKVLTHFQPGNNLILTLDAKMQKIAQKSMKEKSGGVIVLRPSNGEILTLVSSPDYEPNILISPKKKRREKHLKYIRKSKAELNRVISSKFPPASAFKPLVALAGLEEDRINANQRFTCKGKFTLKSSYAHLPDTTFFCWQKHGKNTLIPAMAHSCSSYFYQLGYKLGSESVLKYAKYFRLNQKTEIDLPNEISSFLPSHLWKEKRYGQRWFDGDTINLSIGQGFIETTLISLANFYAAIANHGIMYKPHLIKEIRYAENDRVKEVIQPEIINELPLNRSTLEILHKGLKGVTDYGTARGIFRSLFVAGKTGTVQIRSDKRIDPDQHAWFIAYGPYNKSVEKMIVVGVFIEKGGSGTSAAPIARDIFQYWSKAQERI